MKILLVMMALVLAGAGVSLHRDAWAAPALTVPPAPPGQLACASGWKTGVRVAGVDDGVGYQIDSGFDLANRTGRLVRRALSSSGAADNDGSGAGLVVSAPVWDAGAVLDSGAPPPAARRIFTARADGATVPLRWDQLDPSQRLSLDPDGDGLGEARIDYLRGQREREGSALRRRAALLGDIVRSSPLLVGAPLPQQGADFAAYYEQVRRRQKLVYVGANDGMLHAFDWGSGVESFAFLPPALLPRLRDFADPAKATAHLALLDGSPAVGDAVLDRRWRSVIVTGMGMGARGVFALDVTDPAAGPTLLWEFSDGNDGAVGHVHAPPQIVKLAIKAPGAAATFRYFAVVASGINPRDASADGMLFLLALDKPVGEPWRLGGNYHRIRAPARDPATSNALAPAVVVLAADGSARTAYAGDMQGTMWRFDLRRWNAGGESVASALFTARAADGASQPITQAARVVHAPGGGYLILFGTGKTLETADVEVAGFSQQSFYAVRDKMEDGGTPTSVASRSALAERRLANGGNGNGGDGGAGFAIDGRRFDYNGSGAGIKQGWYVDFPRASQDGERSAIAPQLNDGSVLITTSAPGRQLCAPVVRAYLLDTLTGLALDRRGIAKPGNVSGLAMNGADASLPLLLAGASVHGPVTPTGSALSLRQLLLYQLPASGAGPAQVLDQAGVSSTVGRVSWREISNWRELHGKAAPPPPTP